MKDLRELLRENLPEKVSESASEPIDVVSLIESKPSLDISDFNSRILQKASEHFNEAELQMYITSFMCYINYHQTNDFVIDLDNIRSWIGFDKKVNAKRLLENNFQQDVDFVIVNLAPHFGGASSKHGGQNKEQILLNIRTFKKFCMKARTKQADKIHDYYIKVEEIYHELVMEDSRKFAEMVKIKEIENEQLKERLTTKREETFFATNDRKKCLYIGMVTDTIVEFGITENIRNRTDQHKKRHIGEHYFLEEVYTTKEELKLENMIKDRLEKYRIPTKETEKLVEEGLIKHKQTELLRLTDDFTLSDLKKKIEKFRRDIEDPRSNSELLDTIEELENEIKQLKEQVQELTGEVPVTYKTVIDSEANRNNQKQKHFLECILWFIDEYKNKQTLENSKYFKTEQNTIMIDDESFYNIYAKYMETYTEFKYTENQVGNLIPNQGKETFAHMKTYRKQITGSLNRERPHVRHFYINELKEYIPKKIEEIENRNVERVIKTKPINNKPRRPKTNVITDEKRIDVWKFVLEMFKNETENVFMYSNKYIQEEYRKFITNYTPLHNRSLGSVLLECEYIEFKKHHTYRQFNKRLVEKWIHEHFNLN